MQPVTESVFEKEPSNNHLWLGVLTPDPAHVVASYFGFVNVGHGWDLWHTKVTISGKYVGNWEYECDASRIHQIEGSPPNILLRTRVTSSSPLAIKVFTQEMLSVPQTKNICCDAMSVCGQAK